MAKWYDSKTKEVATQRAQKLQTRLIEKLGGKWKVEISRDSAFKGKKEGGWHYRVWLGCMSVSQWGERTYSCLLSDTPGKQYGLGSWHKEDEGQTPEGIVMAQMLNAHQVISKYTNALYKETWCKMVNDRLRPKEAM